MPFSSRQLADVARIADPLLYLHTLYARVPGVAFGLRHGDDTVLLGAHGVADVASESPVDPATTSFRCASITKTFTTTLIMRLAERGKLRLDDSVREWLPWTVSAVGSNLTIRHLLMHAGGVLRDGENDWSTSLSNAEELRREFGRGATFTEPSVHFRYSNVAFSMLGEIAEQASGRAYGTLLRREVLTPLGLNDTYPDLVPAARRKLATGYFLGRPNEPTVEAGHFAARAVAPAAGLVSTVPNLLEYLAAHFPGDQRLLGEYSKREMQRTQWLRDEEPNFGLGWMSWHVEGTKILGHSGGYPGFVTKIGFSPVEQLAGAVLTNANSPLAAESLNLLFHLAAQVKGRWANAEASTKWHTRGTLAPFVGCYRIWGGDLLVVRINGSLFLVDPKEPSPLSVAARLVPKGPRRFLIAEGDDFGHQGEIVTFGVDHQGRIATLKYGPSLLIKEPL
jgi:CubicO group peptidase (beta-lactamase class C family)